MDFSPQRKQFQTRYVPRTVPSTEGQPGLDSMKRSMENSKAGYNFGAKNINRARLDDDKRTDYEVQLSRGHLMASYNMLKRAETAFRTAIKMDERDYRGWKGLSELLESNNQRTTELFEMYLTMLTFAKPKLKEEWTEICDKALKLHTELGGNSTVKMKLRLIKLNVIISNGYPDFDAAVIRVWTDLISSRPTKLTEVDDIIIKSACRMVKDSPKTSKLDQMKCDIILSLTRKDHWSKVEAKCLQMHKLYPSEKLPMQVLAKQYIKQDIGSIDDTATRIYINLYIVDEQSSLAAIGFGQSMLADEEYQSAIIWLTKGVALDKNNVYGWLYLAEAQIAVRDLKEAYKSSIKGLELLKDKPDTSSSRSIRGQLESYRLEAAVESNDPIIAIGALVEKIPLQSLNNQIPTDLYQKLIHACKGLHDQRVPFRQANTESMREWKRGKRTDYHLQHAIKHWENGMETRTDPWMFLTSILKALKQNPWNVDVLVFLGRYLWEMLAELRLSKEFFELAYGLRPGSETGSYLVDICMVLQDKHTACRVLTTRLRSSPDAKWIWLRLGLIQMNAGDYNRAETSFGQAINADSESDRQPYECLARNHLRRRYMEYDAIQAFEIGAKLQLQPHYFGQLFTPHLSDKDLVSLEATDLRAMYSDTHQWISYPLGTGVQFAFSILYAICTDLLRPLGFDFYRVDQARKTITNVYGKGRLCQAGPRIDWGASDMQCAYMLRFFLIHCQFVHQLLSTRNILGTFPTGNHLRVCCVGGGPGSDIIGLLTFLRSNNMSYRLTCHVLDKYPAWENVWKHIQARLPPPAVNASYLSLDMTSPNPSAQVVEAISQADIVTFVKSVSTVVAFLQRQVFQMQNPFMPVKYSSGAIPAILRNMKKGALAIYIDNRQGNQNRIFVDMAVSVGLRLLHQRTWRCDIGPNVTEYNAVWKGRGFLACESCWLQGYVFYKP